MADRKSLSSLFEVGGQLTKPLGAGGWRQTKRQKTFPLEAGLGG